MIKTKNIGIVKIMNISNLVNPEISEIQMLNKKKNILSVFRYFKNKNKAMNPINNEKGSKYAIKEYSIKDGSNNKNNVVKKAVISLINSLIIK